VGGFHFATQNIAGRKSMIRRCESVHYFPLAITLISSQGGGTLTAAGRKDSIKATYCANAIDGIAACSVPWSR
jgi:hypothetical protein